MSFADIDIPASAPVYTAYKRAYTLFRRMWFLIINIFVHINASALIQQKKKITTKSPLCRCCVTFKWCKKMKSILLLLLIDKLEGHAAIEDWSCTQYLVRGSISCLISG